MESLLTPSNTLISEYIKRFNNDRRYYPADQAIINLFQAFPENVKLEDIILKISVLNDLYSTNIFGTFIMAEHIQKLNIDAQLVRGDSVLVNQISSGHGIVSRKTNRELNFYSFATKYCNWHNRDQYAIYDSYVEKILLAYKRKDNFFQFKNSDLKIFPEFKKVVLEFIDYYSLTEYDLKEIDKFLWMYGKEKFPIKYS